MCEKNLAAIKKLIGLTDGGKATINDIGGGGATNLTQKEFNAYKEARLICLKVNGQDWQKAEKILNDAGFRTYYE